MTDVERMHEERINALDKRVEILSQKVDDFIAESRRRDEKQDARMQQFEQRMDAMGQRMDTMGQRMDNTLSQIYNLVTAAIIGIGTITAAVIAFVATR